LSLALVAYDYAQIGSTLAAYFGLRGSAANCVVLLFDGRLERMGSYVLYGWLLFIVLVVGVLLGAVSDWLMLVLDLW